MPRTSTAIQSAVDTAAKAIGPSWLPPASRQTKVIATAQVGGLRTELNNVIDPRLRATRSTPSLWDFNSRLQVSDDELSSDLQARLKYRQTSESTTQIRGAQQKRSTTAGG